jgi:hypothetical protein
MDAATSAEASVQHTVAPVSEVDLFHPPRRGLLEAMGKAEPSY